MNKPERQSLTRMLEATGEAMQAGLPAAASLAIAIADEGDQMPQSLRDALADAAREGGQPALRLAGTVGANCEAWLASVESGPAQGTGLVLIADALPRARKVPAGAVLVIADVVALLAVSILIRPSSPRPGSTSSPRRDRRCRHRRAWRSAWPTR